MEIDDKVPSYLARAGERLNGIDIEKREKLAKKSFEYFDKYNQMLDPWRKELKNLWRLALNAAVDNRMEEEEWRTFIASPHHISGIATAVIS